MSNSQELQKLAFIRHLKTNYHTWVTEKEVSKINDILHTMDSRIKDYEQALTKVPEAERSTIRQGLDALSKQRKWLTDRRNNSLDRAIMRVNQLQSQPHSWHEKLFGLRRRYGLDAMERLSFLKSPTPVLPPSPAWYKHPAAIVGGAVLGGAALAKLLLGGRKNSDATNT